jgi:hypothetical protein
MVEIEKKLKDGYPKLTIFKDEYPNCKSKIDEISRIINKIIPNSYFKT